MKLKLFSVLIFVFLASIVIGGFLISKKTFAQSESFIFTCGPDFLPVHCVSLWAYPDTDEQGKSIIKAHASLRVLGLPIGAPYLNSLFVVEPYPGAPSSFYEDGCTSSGFGTSVDFGKNDNNLLCTGSRFEWPDASLGGDWKTFYRDPGTYTMKAAATGFKGTVITELQVTVPEPPPAPAAPPNEPPLPPPPTADVWLDDGFLQCNGGTVLKYTTANADTVELWIWNPFTQALEPARYSDGSQIYFSPDPPVGGINFTVTDIANILGTTTQKLNARTTGFVLKASNQNGTTWSEMPIPSDAVLSFGSQIPAPSDVSLKFSSLLIGQKDPTNDPSLGDSTIASWTAQGEVEKWLVDDLTRSVRAEFKDNPNIRSTTLTANQFPQVAYDSSRQEKFKITAVNDCGSQSSNEIGLTISGPPTPPSPPPSPPTGLSASCEIPGNTAKLSWNSVDKADYYIVRVDNLKNGFAGTPTCCNGILDGDTCTNLDESVLDTDWGKEWRKTCADPVGNEVQLTSYSAPASAGDSYRWWLHACNNTTGCGKTADGGNFTCAAPLQVEAGGPYSVSVNQPIKMSGAFTSGGITPLAFSWTIENRPLGAKDGWIDSSGILQPSFNTDTVGTYTAKLTATDQKNQKGSDTATINVTGCTSAKTPRLSLTALPASINQGQKSNLLLTGQNLSSCSYSSNPKDITWDGLPPTFAGSLLPGQQIATAVYPSKTTDYSLTCQPADSACSPVSASAKVNVAETFCPAKSFSPSPPKVEKVDIIDCHIAKITWSENSYNWTAQLRRSPGGTVDQKELGCPFQRGKKTFVTTDTALEGGKTYEYTATGWNWDGVYSGESNKISRATPPCAAAASACAYRVDKINITGTKNINQDIIDMNRQYPDAVSYTVSSASGNTINTDAPIAGIEAGDEVLIIALQGGAEAGNYEIKKVSAVDGPNKKITLDSNLSKSYGDKTIVQRIPHFTYPITIKSGGLLTADSWDGTKGGVFTARFDDLTIEDGGKIDMAGKGFRGGVSINDWISDWWFCRSTAGEGLGGGGAGNLGGTTGGTTVGPSAGAGAGYNVKGSDSASVGGGTFGTVPGASGGSSYGDNELSKLYLGSGGGGGGGTLSASISGYCSSLGGSGGRGGGIAILLGKNIAMKTNSQILTQGNDGGGSVSNGGGGSGGSVFIDVNTFSWEAGAKVNINNGLGVGNAAVNNGYGSVGRALIKDGSGTMNSDLANINNLLQKSGTYESWFAGETCPSGYSSKENFTSTKSQTCDSAKCNSACTTGSHLRENRPQESCGFTIFYRYYFEEENVCGGGGTCAAPITERLCYKNFANNNIFSLNWISGNSCPSGTSQVDGMTSTKATSCGGSGCDGGCCGSGSCTTSFHNKEAKNQETCKYRISECSSNWITCAADITEVLCQAN